MDQPHGQAAIRPRLKICHVAGVLHGGPQTFLQQIMEHQKAAGHEVSVVFSDLRDDEAALRKAFGPELRLIPWHVGREIEPGRDWRAYQQLRRILAAERPDVLHLHSSKAGLHGRFAARALGLPAVYTPHGVAFLRTDVSRATHAIYRTAEHLAARAWPCPIVALSEEEREAVAGLPAPVTLIPNGVDVAALEHMTADARPRRADGGLRIGILGRISQQRAPYRVKAIARGAAPDWEIIWIGDGELRHEVEGERITLMGWQPREEALRILRSCDVMLHPSLWEGMPFALLEAMALGLPAVVSDAAGNRSLIENGRSGYVISGEDGYLPALRRLAEDPDLRLAMGRAARQRVLDHFDVRAQAVEWEALYRQDIARVAGTARGAVPAGGTPAAEGR